MDVEFKKFLLKKKISEEKYDGMTGELQFKWSELFDKSKPQGELFMHLLVVLVFSCVNLKTINLSGNLLPSAEKTARSGHKRPYLATLYHNLNSTPSSFCKTDDKEGSWQQQLNLGFRNHRPSASNAGIPATLLHEAFGIFKDTFNNASSGLVAEDFNFTANFCREMSKVYDGKNGENMRRDAANSLLGEYLNVFMTPSEVCNAGKSETDGTVFALVGNDKKLPMPIRR